LSKKVKNGEEVAVNISEFDKDINQKLDKQVTRVVKLLSLSNKSVATAESCTGGLLSELITSVPGASGVFECGVCSYSNRIKHSILGVDNSILDEFTEVSSQTAVAMARGMKNLSGADIAVSVTGIAGPGGGTPEKPVGTVFVGFASEQGCYARHLDLSGRGLSREQIRKHTALNVFNEVEAILTGENNDE
jgi:nicotinamide-nucleotide amidase